MCRALAALCAVFVLATMRACARSSSSAAASDAAAAVDAEAKQRRANTMITKVRRITLGALPLAGLAAVTAVHADESAPTSSSPDSMMGEGMMQGDGMMGMMGMMNQMTQMMTTCNQMMQGMMQHEQSPAEAVEPPKRDG
jgi:hypothetical protein